MRPSARAIPLGLTLALLGVGMLCGCGGKDGGGDGAKPLTFEKLPGGTDTTNLAEGKSLIEKFDLIRMTNGALRVTGHTRLPEGTKLQIRLYETVGRVAVASTQVTVDHGDFGSPPFVGDTGPLKVATYRVEILAHFTPDWQPANVLAETGGGKRLRGPGITRSKQDDAALYLVEEMRR